MKKRYKIPIIIAIIIGGLIVYEFVSSYIENYNYITSREEYLAKQPTINVTGIIQHWQPIDGPAYSIIPEEDTDFEINEYRGIFLYGQLNPSLEGKRVTVSGTLIESYVDFQLKTLGGAFGGDPDTALILVEDVISFEPEPSKTWMEFEPTQIWNKPWDFPWQHYGLGMTSEEINVVKNYYQEKGIVIFDARAASWGEVAICEALDCPAGYTLYLLISNTEIPALQKLGFIPSTDVAELDSDTTHNWIFHSLEPYSCGDVDCYFKYVDEKCDRGYLLNEKGEPVYPLQRGIHGQTAKIDYNLCN